MLVLSRKVNERARLKMPDGAVVWVSVERISYNAVRLGIAAPPDVDIAREELIADQKQERAQ